MNAFHGKITLEQLEYKIAKHIGLLYQAKKLFNTRSLKSIYFSYIYTYLNYTENQIEN